jgi:hypothetical protein
MGRIVLGVNEIRRRERQRSRFFIVTSLNVGVAARLVGTACHAAPDLGKGYARGNQI